VSQIRDSTNLDNQVPVLTRIFPRNRVTQLYPQAPGFVGLRWRYSTSSSDGDQLFSAGLGSSWYSPGASQTENIVS
jgi:hypothetical protein